MKMFLWLISDKDLLIIAHAATMDAATRAREKYPGGTLNEYLAVMRESVRDFPLGSVGIVTYNKDSDNEAASTTWTLSSVNSTSDSILKRNSSASDFSGFNT